MSADPNKKSARTFQCRDVLWETFEQMARELECSIDYLINESMKQYARQRSYSPRTPFPGQARVDGPGLRPRRGQPPLPMPTGQNAAVNMGGATPPPMPAVGGPPPPPPGMPGMGPPPGMMPGMPPPQQPFAGPGAPPPMPPIPGPGNAGHPRQPPAHAGPPPMYAGRLRSLLP